MAGDTWFAQEMRKSSRGGSGEYPLKVILEFPSVAAGKGWYDSDEYQAILPFRRRNSKGNLIWVEGV